MLSVLSLMACLAGIVTWGRSYRIGDTLFVTHGTRCVAVTSEGGSYAFSTFLRPEVHVDRWSWGSYSKRTGAVSAVCRLVLFGWAPEKVGAHDLVVPQWTVPAIFGPLPAVRIAGWFRRRRRADTHACPACGYDLRATPDRCPECFTETRARG
jgi:hypothetical protein